MKTQKLAKIKKILEDTEVKVKDATERFKKNLGVYEAAIIIADAKAEAYDKIRELLL
jgi:hypothetical protein